MSKAKSKLTPALLKGLAPMRTPAIDLGALQSEFIQSRSHLRAAESSLLRAQEARDKAIATHAAAQRALSDGHRAVDG